MNWELKEQQAVETTEDTRVDKLFRGRAEAKRNGSTTNVFQSTHVLSPKTQWFELHPRKKKKDFPAAQTGKTEPEAASLLKQGDGTPGHRTATEEALCLSGPVTIARKSPRIVDVNDRLV